MSTVESGGEWARSTVRMGVGHSIARSAVASLLGGLVACGAPQRGSSSRDEIESFADSAPSVSQNSEENFEEIGAPASSSPHERPSWTTRPVPTGFVDLAAAVPELRFEIRYATENNFTGAPLPGYGAPGAWLRADAAAALAAVQEELAREGLGLLIYDAYRPARASRAMVTWAREAGRADLVKDGYIASSSNHGRGNTVDLTVVDADGSPLDMGTAFDTFTADSGGPGQGPARRNRSRLRRAMRRHGFVPYAAEWWHFTHRPDDSSRDHRRPPILDVPYGVDEPPARARKQTRVP
jgi:zinc D-Ala-D-Ala dipeptidase